MPQEGIKLLRDGVIYKPIGAAGFRIETLLFDKIMKDLSKWLKSMPGHVR